MGRLQALVDQTPPERRRHIDLLRAVAILAVVCGHWLAADVVREGDLLTHVNAVQILEWSHPITWLFQVMPLFFIVGGYANAASLRSHQARGDGSIDWLLNRSERLLRPVTVLLLVVSGIGVLAALLGVDTGQLGIMAHGAVLPLWFLVAYLAVVVLTPVMYALHRRFGLLVPLALVALVAAGDALRFGLEMEWAAAGNLLFLWLAAHQAGFAWQDDQRSGPRLLPVALVLTGAAVLVLGTSLGPYPLSMVDVPGEEIQNVAPPSLALLALATVQLGVALLLSRVGERWMQRPRAWGAVVAVNTVTFSMFLWHMSAVVIVALALDAAGVLPEFDVGSPAWLWWQLPWLAMLTAALLGLLAVVARIERPGDPRTGISGWVSARLFGERRSSGHDWILAAATLVGLAAALGGMFLIADAGAGDQGMIPLPTLGLVTWLAAALILWLCRLARARRSA